MAAAINDIQIKSSQSPKHLLDAINKNHAELWVSCRSSNSLITIFCAENALIVVKPCIVAVIWLNTGLFAENY